MNPKPLMLLTDMIGYFVSSFLIWVLIVYLIFAIIQFFKKKKFSDINRKKIAIIAAIFSLIPTITHMHDVEKRRVNDDKRFQEIIRVVIQYPDSLTMLNRKEFWSIMKRSYVLNDKSIHDLKDLMTGISSEYQKYLYEDALNAFITGKPDKSILRDNYEKQLLKNGAITELRIKENEEWVEKVAFRKAIKIQGQDVVLNDEMIRIILSNLDDVSKRVDTLFSNPF